MNTKVASEPYLTWIHIQYLQADIFANEYCLTLGSSMDLYPVFGGSWLYSTLLQYGNNIRVRQSTYRVDLSRFVAHSVHLVAAGTLQW